PHADMPAFRNDHIMPARDTMPDHATIDVVVDQGPTPTDTFSEPDYQSPDLMHAGGPVITITAPADMSQTGPGQIMVQATVVARSTDAQAAVDPATVIAYIDAEQSKLMSASQDTYQTMLATPLQ